MQFNLHINNINVGKNRTHDFHDDTWWYIKELCEKIWSESFYCCKVVV